MTKTIVGILGAAFLTAGAGAGTVYKMVKAPAVTVEAPPPASVNAESSAEADAPNGGAQQVSLGGVVIRKDGKNTRLEAGNVKIQRSGKSRSVSVGDGIEVRRDESGRHVKVGNIEVDRSGNGKNVKIGGLDLGAD